MTSHARESLKLAFKMGLSPQEFWSLTPHELNVLAEAHNEKTEQMIRLIKYFVSHLMWASNAGGWKRGTSPKTFMQSFDPKPQSDELSPMQKLHREWLEGKANGQLS